LFPYLVRRLLAVIPVMAVVVTIVFLLIHLIPGDPVSVMLGPDASPAQIEATRRSLGLDRPVYQQLLGFYGRVLRGDLGQSYFLDRPVVTAIVERAEPTLMLMACALLVAVVIGVPSGIVAAARLGWLPAAGYASLFTDPVSALRYMVLPAVSLGFNQSALIARISRSCMLEALQQDYVRTARAKGLPNRAVTYVHAFRNALVPVVTVIGVTTAVLIGGAVVTEIVFNIPGLGRLVISEILRRDYPVVQGVVLVAAALLADVVSTHNPTLLVPANRLQPPSAEHYLGTDEFGRDVYSLVLHGSRVSLLVGLTTMLLTSAGGIVIGLTAGYARRLDVPVMRCMDGLMAFPAILLAIALMAARGPGVWNVILALSVVYMPRTAMLIRSTVLSLRELDYIQAARALGRHDGAIALRHILPNCVGPLLVQGSFVFAYAILAEAILGFLGVGVPPYVPSWGNVIASGKNVIREAFWVSLFPGLALTLSGLSLNLLGDGLRDVLDPRLRVQ